MTALKLVRKFAGGEKNVGEAALGFDGTDLLIGLSGVTHRAPATGEWPGTARVPGAFVMRFVHIAATNDPVDLTVVGDQLAIRSTSWAYDIACTWEKAARRDIGLPVNATLRDKVAFGLVHDPEQVEALGLTGVIGPAMAEFEKRSAAASKALVEFGVTPRVIRSLVKGLLDGGATRAADCLRPLLAPPGRTPRVHGNRGPAQKGRIGGKALLGPCL